MTTASQPVQPASSLDLPTYLASRGRLIDEALERYLPPADYPPALIHQAMRYCIFAGGKRLRPLLVLASTEACGGDVYAGVPVACAVELIHTYSLIHDDLPAMDNSDTRRGRPTCHVAFGDAIAVLAGDALHALAFALVAETAPVVGAERALAVAREIAAAIGTRGMVGGQVLDLLGEGRSFPYTPPLPAAVRGDMVKEIHLRKTAALMRACARAGGILADAEEPTLSVLGTYGERVGLAYQIIDDVLDVVGEEAKLGKRSGSDAALSKATYPAVYGIPASRDMAAQLTSEATAAIGALGDRGRMLRDLAHNLLVREY